VIDLQSKQPGALSTVVLPAINLAGQIAIAVENSSLLARMEGRDRSEARRQPRPVGMNSWMGLSAANALATSMKQPTGSRLLDLRLHQILK
jgi:hypothetical protein